MIAKKNILHVGCSGFHYPAWKNTFYPKGLLSEDWLAYYSSFFNTVELNSSFYRRPQLSTLKKFAAVTPPGFLFSVKMSRYITHILKLRNCAKAIKEIQDLALKGLKEKLGTFLFQLPATFRYGAENLEHVLSAIPYGQHNVVEFRHPSWWNDDVQDQLSKRDITFCNVDYPGLTSFFMSTTDNFYLRLHGTPELFVSKYNEEDLRKYSRAIPVNAKQYYIYFNNTDSGAAIQNAIMMQEILDRKRNLVYA